jgi:hypothetical protein
MRKAKAAEHSTYQQAVLGRGENIMMTHNCNSYRFPQGGASRYWKSLFLVGLMTLAAIGFVNTASAQASHWVPIDKCGTIIGAPGEYSLTQSLQSSSYVTPCIQITSPGVLITSKGHDLIGPGGSEAVSSGIRIYASASGAQLLFSGSTIKGFGIGILVEASGVSLVGGQNGITVAENAAQGILVSNASSVLIEGTNANSNGAAGLELSHASGVIVQDNSFVQFNAGHGLWLHSSSGNQFFGLESSGNKLNGIYIGESGAKSETEPAGKFELPGGVLARWPNPVTSGRSQPSNSDPSKNNVFIGGAAIENGASGILIGDGDVRNVVVDMYAQSNEEKDLTDENGSCNANTWSGNAFTSAAPSCIR